jgi:hypothetical protein
MTATVPTYFFENFKLIRSGCFPTDDKTHLTRYSGGGGGGVGPGGVVFVFFCFRRFNKEKARKEIVTSPQKGKNWTIFVQ